MTSSPEDHGEIDQSSKSQSNKFFVSSSHLTITRFNVLLSIFILQFLVFLTLVGVVLTSSDDNNTSSSPSMTPAQESLVCPLSVDDKDPWACDLLRAQQLLGQQDCHDSKCKRRTSSSSSSDRFKQLVTPTSQCLLLSEGLEDEVCQEDHKNRRDQFSKYSPSFCHTFPLRILSDSSWMSANASSCKSILKTVIADILRKDELARNISCQFNTLISRYNCQTGYSVQWSCSNCMKTYHDWICATILPVFSSGLLRKPCHSFCKRVEERCPYLHPSHKEQYAGEPAFICIDPYIPFIPSLTPVIPFDDSRDCFDETILENTSSQMEEMQSDDTNSSRVIKTVDVLTANSDSTDQEDSEEKSDDDLFDELDSLTTTTTANPGKS